MASIDISGVVGKAYVADAQAAAGALSIQANQAATQTSFTDTKAHLTAIGNADALVAETTGLGQLTTEAATQRVGLSIGEDPTDLMGLQAQRAKDLLAAQKDRTAALARVNEKRKVSFFDNPLDWVTNQFTINDDIEAHNAANANIGNIEGQIEESNKFLSTAQDNFKRQQTTVTAGSVAAQAARVKELAAVQSDLATRQAYASSSEAVLQLTELSAKQLQFAAQAVNAQQTAEQIRLAQAHLALSQEEFDWKKLQKTQGEAANEYLRQTINRGLKVLDPNQPELSDQNPKLLGIIQGKVPLDGLLKQAFDLGETNRKVDPSGNTSRVLGATPLATISTLQYSPYLSPDQAPVVRLMVETATAAKGSAAYKVIEANKDVKAAEAYINNAVQEVFKTAATKVADPTNPYFLPPVDIIIAQTKGLQELSTYQKVLAPAIAARIDLSTPDNVIQLIASAASKGDISANQAALDVATIWKQGQRINVESKQLKNMGIAPIVSYNVPIRTGAASTPVTDVSNPNEVLRAINIIMARKYNSGPGAFSAELSASPIIKGAAGAFKLFDEAATASGDSMKNSEGYKDAMNNYWASEGLGKRTK